MSIENSERIMQYNMNHIADTAMDLFFSKGIKETSVEEIAKQGKISRVTIYKYFPTKLDIVVLVFRRYLRVWSPLIRETFFSESYPTLNGFEQIHLQLSIYSEIHLKNSAFLPFLSELNILMGQSDIESETRKHNNSINKDFNEFYFNAIRKGVEDGSICKRSEFEDNDYLYVRKIIEGIYLKCYLCFGREHFTTHKEDIYEELIFAVDKISIAFLSHEYNA